MKKLMIGFVALLSIVMVIIPHAFADAAAVVALTDLPWYKTAVEYYMIITSVLGTASVLATMTPTPKDDALIGKLQKLIHFVGMNFGFAKNKG